MFIRIWEYRVHPEMREEFIQRYGPSGDWVKLFRKGKGYIGTELMQSLGDEGVFITIDRWSDTYAWVRFTSAYGMEYTALDERCSTLTVSEDDLGTFTVADG